MLRRHLLAALAASISPIPPIPLESIALPDRHDRSDALDQPASHDPPVPPELLPPERKDAWVAGEDTAGPWSGPPGETTAVVDRIANGTAVVVYDDRSRQRTVPAAVLPSDARREGVVLRVPAGDALALAEVDRTATRERREDARDRFDELAERPD